MSIKQLSAYAENKPGTVYEILKTLADAGINLKAINIADTKDFGIIRLITDDNDKAREALGEDTIVGFTEVIAVEMVDKVGSLSSIIKVLSDAGINIEYLYSFTRPTKLGTYAVIRVDNTAEAERSLSENGMRIINQEDLF